MKLLSLDTSDRIGHEGIISVVEELMKFIVSNILCECLQTAYMLYMADFDLLRSNGLDANR